ncbi:MAG: UvrD-helicase domain-containing protein [Pseudomonadota bacterium]
MKYIADLHIHSRFSRATSRSLDLPRLDYWAGRKGLAVVGTGDMTHPQWLAEIKEQLVEAEDGLYKLKPDYILSGEGETRFILSGEISSIYKQGGRVRKVHSVVLLPNLAAAEKYLGRLDRLGNVKSDGRPILGLSAKDLLEISLDTDPDCIFIPAHIWTPWFSLLGSNSGFDSLEECFLDLTPHIKALETGLSSDPPMNWRLSALDGYILTSNSDAHSPDKLGREANLIDAELSYPGLAQALGGRGGFEGTIEFFPEEGKYHLDGHRNCRLRLDPEETRRSGGLCPVCGRAVTVGVMNRVLELADRPAGFKPDGAQSFYHLIPLKEILGEVLGFGSASKKTTQFYDDILAALGPELYILRDAPLDDVGRAGGLLLEEAVTRMRAGRVLAEAGYDGEYGRISLFGPGEKDKLAGQSRLFALGPTETKKKSETVVRKKATAVDAPLFEMESPLLSLGDPLVDDLNPAQREAVIYGPGPLGIVAGPGSGKTTVLARRAAWLVREGLAVPREILGIAFTRQAAGEMSARLASNLPFRPNLKEIPVLTFHALGRLILSDYLGPQPEILLEEERLVLVKKAARGFHFKANELVVLISLLKQKLVRPADVEDPSLAKAYGRYEEEKKALGRVDFDDLVMEAAALLAENQEVRSACRRRFKWLLVDEYQDVNLAQYVLVGHLAGNEAPNLTVIGDPDQAIYGFRGADSTYFQKFSHDFPTARIVRLSRNYRSSETILRAAGQVISHNPGPSRVRLDAGFQGPAKINTATLPTPKAEAEFVAYRIESLLGGSSHFALDSGRAGNGPDAGLTLGDVAVLYRIHALAGPVAEALARSGLPFQQAGVEPGQETDELNFSAEKISLLTMHAAKGLEFELVFLIGLEEGLLPYHPPGKPPADLEEERRLFFVALTRAKRHLFLTRALSRTLFGKKRQPDPSCFWREIERGLTLADKLPDRKPKVKTAQLTLF